ncbi:MAG: SMP-30/gluconolactonase/LRE family protein [Bacteroidia bacterium]|nr:SMP-30/gluconolactonase/LRE family protein [Bacteroidia bacterium]
MKTSYIISLMLFSSIGVSLCSCSLQPLAWNPPQKPEMKGVLEENQMLTQVSKIDLQGWYGPEDIVQDSLGNIYCGVHIGKEDFSDGKILKISPQGKVSVFYDAGSWVAGLHFDNRGNLLALSHKEGLIRIDPQGKASILLDRDDKGRPFYIPNGLDLAKNGTIYFSNTSHFKPYTVRYGRKVILEAKPLGGLYAFNPLDGKLKTLIEGSYFGNGVVLSENEDFLLMTETSKYQIIRYWLKGPQKGQTEVFMQNLPGFPNGISRRKNGSFWLGFSTKRNDALDKIHSKVWLKKLTYALPEVLQPKQEKYGMILNISEEGEILSAYFDPTGESVPEAGSVKEFEGILYIGGDIVPYISTYKLNSED